MNDFLQQRQDIPDRVIGLNVFLSVAEEREIEQLFRNHKPGEKIKFVSKGHGIDQLKIGNVVKMPTDSSLGDAGHHGKIVRFIPTEDKEIFDVELEVFGD